MLQYTVSCCSICPAGVELRQPETRPRPANDTTPRHKGGVLVLPQSITAVAKGWIERPSGIWIQEDIWEKSLDVVVKKRLKG